MTTAARKRISPGAAALSDHAKICGHCLGVALAGKPPTELCARGRILVTAALMPRIRRQAS